jgi:hypothetical protein
MILRRGCKAEARTEEEEMRRGREEREGVAMDKGM